MVEDYKIGDLIVMTKSDIFYQKGDVLEGGDDSLL